MNYFVAGADTGVGKTYVTTLLTRALRKSGLDTVALKPVCCGSREDVHILRAAAEGELTAEEINPLFFEPAASPLAASREKQQTVEIEPLAAWYQALRTRHRSLLIEGAGGWLMPLTATRTMADVAALVQLPILLVVANRLGCLNHTLLNIESIRARGLQCGGIVLNSQERKSTIAHKTNKETLRQICDVPVLFEILPGQDKIELPTS